MMCVCVCVRQPETSNATTPDEKRGDELEMNMSVAVAPAFGGVVWCVVPSQHALVVQL